MLMVVIDIVSFLIVVAWCLILLLVVAFLVMAMIEFGRALAGVVASSARRLGHSWERVTPNRHDERFLRHFGIRR